MSVALIKKDHEQHAADPVRAALAAAIEAERDALAAIDTCRENLEKGGRALDAVRADLDSARNLVERARERDGRAAAASIRKSASAPPDASKTVRGARLRVQELEDDVEIAEAAIGRLQDDLVQAEAAVDWAVVGRMAAANAVLAPICGALLDTVRAARRDGAVGKALLLLLLNDPAREAPEFRNDALAGIRASERITAPLAGLRAEAEGATTRNSSDEDRAAVEAAVAGMEFFLGRLAVDATAEPPAIP